MSMNHDNGDRQTVTESELTTWLWTQKSNSVYNIRQRKRQSGKRWARREYIVTSQSYITKLQERSRLAFSGRLR
jgi:hypothetical protein